MAYPRPSLTMLMDLDDCLATDQTREEIMRGFNFCGTTLVRTHETATTGNTVENDIRLLVKMGNHKYLHTADEGSDDLWNNVMVPWLRSQFINLSNNVMIYNRRQREIENTELNFTWLQVELENGVIDIDLRLDSIGGIGEEVVDTMTAMRTALDAGELGDDVVSIAAPSDASYAQQAEAGLAAKAQREAEEAEAEAAARAAAEAEAAAKAELADATFLEAPDLVEEPVDEDAVYRENLKERFKVIPADFPIAYDVWTVTYADGTTRDFDATTGQFA